MRTAEKGNGMGRVLQTETTTFLAEARPEESIGTLDHAELNQLFFSQVNSPNLSLLYTYILRN